MENLRTITPREAHDLLCNAGEGYLLLDVRTPKEFGGAHAGAANNMPLHTICGESVQQLKERKVICICQKGGRGAQAANLLLQSGVKEVCNVEGGTEAWAQAGLPLIRGPKSMSLERQVRIAAGSLVVAGVAGGFLATPYAFLLSLFVGCGLIFSGITNTCGMAMLLGRCPWNR